MTTRRRQQFVHGHVAWMLGTVLLVAFLDSLSLELFFTSAFVGLLVMIEITVPFDISPEWRTRLRWLILAGLVGFAYLVVMRVLEVIPSRGF